MIAVPFVSNLTTSDALKELRARPQWVAWRHKDIVDAKGQPKKTKPPVNPHTGMGASHSEPATWGSYEQACQRACRDRLPGVGYVITDDDGYTGVDLDKCRDADTGALEPWAAQIVGLGETYVEVSPSGTGLRLIARGKIERTVKCDPAHVEVYRDKRYLTITGHHVDGSPDEIREAPQTLDLLLARVAEFSPPIADEWAPSSSSSETPSPFRQINNAALANLSSWVP
jgi:primase-polymerase (primpol)-like protein